MKRKIKKYSITWWKTRLDKKFNPLITSIGYCQRCGRKNGQFHCSHVLPKGTYQGLRYDPLNTLCLCAQCHAWFWHDNPIEAGEWFKAKYPGRYIYLQAAKKIFIKRNQEFYEKIDKALDEKNFENLYTIQIDKFKGEHLLN